MISDDGLLPIPTPCKSEGGYYKNVLAELNKDLLCVLLPAGLFLNG